MDVNDLIPSSSLLLETPLESWQTNYTVYSQRSDVLHFLLESEFLLSCSTIPHSFPLLAVCCSTLLISQLHLTAYTRVSWSWDNSDFHGKDMITPYSSPTHPQLWGLISCGRLKVLGMGNPFSVKVLDAKHYRKEWGRLTAKALDGLEVAWGMVGFIMSPKRKHPWNHGTDNTHTQLMQVLNLRDWGFVESSLMGVSQTQGLGYNQMNHAYLKSQFL